MIRSAAQSGDGALVDRVMHFRPGLLVGAMLSGLLALLLVVVWGYQMTHGIGVAGINRPVFWGFYILHFVFWIGISHAGTLISAILRVTQAEWRRPLTRCAEAITVFALSVGALFPLIHLGRPWLFWYMLPFPNDRYLWPNYRSPLQWDVAAITTYLTGSLVYLALPLIPDFAILRDRWQIRGGLRSHLYRWLALGWKGTPDQWHTLEWGIKILAVAIIPVAISVHTIVSWDFAMTRVPGWKSTIFGPYFVVGAIYSGIAVLLVAMALLRRGLQLADVLADKVFDNLCLLFVAMSLLWGYFTFAEHLTVWYGGDQAERAVHHAVLGNFGSWFWLMVVLNVVVPLGILVHPRGRRPLGAAVAGVAVLVGMWLERFLIVVPALSVPRQTFLEGSYAPTWVEISIALGSAGTFVFFYFAFTQLVPIVSLWELREGANKESTAAAARVPEVAR